MFVHMFVDPIYERPVYFLVGSREEYKTFLRSKGVKDKIEGRFGEASYHKLPSPRIPEMLIKHFFLWMVRFNGSDWDIGTLAHECFHTAQFVLEEVGVEFELEGNNEAYAYLIDAMVRQFLTAWREYEVSRNAGVDSVAQGGAVSHDSVGDVRRDDGVGGHPV